MHMRGTPDTMDGLAAYRHVAVEVADELGAAAERAEAAGVARERIAVDPGFGFAKTPEHNFRLLDELATIVALGYPVVVGPSRKRFLGAATGRPVEDRDRASAVACALAWERGARIFRVHDVALAREALAVARATARASRARATSCTRKIRAPRSHASAHATALARSRSSTGRPVAAPRNRLRDGPTTTG